MKCKTFKNKLYAILLIIVGIVSTMIEGDATILAFLGIFAVPMFFAKEPWIY